MRRPSGRGNDVSAFVRDGDVIGWPISAAFFSAAAVIRRASLNVTWSLMLSLDAVYVNSYRRYPNNFFPAGG